MGEKKLGERCGLNSASKDIRNTWEKSCFMDKNNNLPQCRSARAYKPYMSNNGLDKIHMVVAPEKSGTIQKRWQQWYFQTDTKKPTGKDTLNAREGLVGQP